MGQDGLGHYAAFKSDVENRTRNWLMNSSDHSFAPSVLIGARLFRLDKFGPTGADFAQFPFFSCFSQRLFPCFFQRVFWGSGHDSQGHIVFACTGQSK